MVSIGGTLDQSKGHSSFSAEEIWRAALGQLQIQTTRTTFETWLRPTEGISYQNNQLIVEVPTAWFVEWLERRMYQSIEKAITKVLGVDTSVQFQVKMGSLVSDPTESSLNPVESSVESPKVSSPSPAISFNPRYIFNSFVVGTSNRLAFSASQAVVESPGNMYNPLFIYSGVGLGKTHLLHAIGQASSDVGLTSLYVSSEQFTNEYIISIRNGTAEQFRNKYRSVEVLLIDDIQFLSGKEQTQEGFFHTFNDLHNSGQQIVIASDRPPRALALLQDRLRSRFEWGLMADIQAPDLETRMAILSLKAESLELNIEESIIEFIAKRVQKNVRELEGSLNRVVAYSDLMNIPVTIELAVNVLQDLATDAARHSIDPDKIIDQVSKYFGIETVDILGRRRTKTIALSRQIVMYLLSYELEMSPTQIGRILGGRDHATIIHGAGKINAEINEDHQLRQDVLTIKESLFT